jgi:hypothetical protein
MASGYKVRIADGSEIGPMDLEAVKSWYAQGLLQKDSGVLKPGSSRWSTLAQVLDLKGSAKSPSRSSGNGAGGARARSGAGRDFTIDVPEPGLWRSHVAGALLLLLSAVLAFFAFRSRHVRVEIQDAPWTEIALVFAALGLTLVAGWEAGRKVVRVAAFVLAFLVFPVAGILIAQGVRGVALLALLGAWICLSGFFALLAGESISWARAGLALLPILAGGGAFVYFAYSPETAMRRQLREATSPDRRFADDSLGLSMDVPRGWVILQAGNPLVTVPPEARVTLAHPRSGGFGFLTAESSPVGIGSVDQYLDRVWAARQRERPSLKQTGRLELNVGNQPAKRLSGSFDEEGARFQESVTVWRDGWVYFSLVSWLPEGAPRADRDLEALVEGVNTQGDFAVRLQSALMNVTMEVPQLTPAAAEMLMGSSEAKVLEPDQAFRRSIEALSRALPTLSKKDALDLGQITSATYAALVPKDRSALLAYVARVRDRQATNSAQDKEASRIMKAGVLRLAPARRVRLQEIYQQAIQAQMADGKIH